MTILTRTNSAGRRGWAHAQEAWSPSDITTLTAWHRADTVTTSGGNVTSWTDKSGNGHHLAGASNKPAYLSSVAAINNQPAVSFDRTNSEALICATRANADGIRIYMVLQHTVQLLNASFFDTADTLNEMRCRQVGASGDSVGLFAGSNMSDTGFTVSLNSWYVQGVLFNGASSQLDYDNADAFTGNPGNIAASNGMTLGARQGPGEYASFDIAELIISSADLSAADKTNLFNYFNTRYGI